MKIYEIISEQIVQFDTKKRLNMFSIKVLKM